jgi:hypothetical protein
MRKSGIYLILFAMLMSLSCNKDATLVAPPDSGSGTGTATTLTLTYPKGGEAFKANELKTITWTSNSSNKLKLEVSIDGGASWKTISDNIPNTLTYAWIPADSLISSNCLLKISDVATSTASVSGTFQILPNIKKTISLLSPIGGESLVVGGSARIRWSSSNVSTVKIQYSTDAGANWSVVNFAAPADSQGYTWNPIPDAVSNNCKIKISDATADTVSATSAGTFRIYSTQSISILKPASGDTLYIGSSSEVRWNATDIQSVKIEFSTNNGINWISLADNVANTGSYIISSVPNLPSISCKLRISDALDGNPMVTTAYNFSILALPTISISQPNGGEKIAAGTNYTIQWLTTSAKKVAQTKSRIKASASTDAALASSFVKIELSTNSGTTWSTIAASVSNSGSYIWAVDSSLSSTQCRIRISDASTGNPSDISNADFTIYKPVAKTITVISPNGGESWEAGTTKSISWTSTGIDYVKLEYSTDGGTTFSTIANNITATASPFAWNVPSTISNTCKIRISSSADASYSDMSNAVFAITAPQSIAITAPNGGEVLTAGGSFNIKWNSLNIANVKIEYSTNNGVDWVTIVASTPSNGFYTWNPLPNVSSTNCRLRISDAADGIPTDLSDQTFSILAQPTIRVVAPNGGERILAGSSYAISWVTSGGAAKMLAKRGALTTATTDGIQDNPGIQNVKLEYTADGGTSWNVITASTANNGNYIWNPVPNVNSALCRVRVSNAIDGIPSDVSDTVFVIYNQISQSITVNSPNGGESFAAGGSTNITWNSSGVAAVSIDLTTNNGVNWTNIVKNIASNGIYSWSPIPNVASGNCKIRIYDATDSIPSVESKSTFTILPQPSITVLTPNGGEKLSAGSNYSITWTSQAIGKVKIELTQNNGADWTTIVDSVTSTGNYTWTVPNVNSSLCKIRISNTAGGNPSDASDNVFGISNQLAQSVRVISPNGGEQWTAATNQNITWVSSGIDTVKIEYSTNNGIDWTTIVNKTPSNGFYTWQNLPSINSTNCVVKVSNASTGLPWDKSDTVFSIQTPVKLIVTAPNGGEHILAGTSYTIQWNTSQKKALAKSRAVIVDESPLKEQNSISNVRLELSTDGGANWTSIAASVPNTGSYVWNPVPNVNSSLCRVRISDAADVTNADVSDSNFTVYNQIQKSITVNAPNGGEVLTAGGSYNITWTGVAVTAVSIQYSTNNGVSWTSIVSNIASNGIYTWNPIPNISSTNCKVRVSNAADSLLYDDSNAPFTILPQPAVTVLTPNGGEHLQFGTPYTITWTSQAIAKVKLEYTINNGADWITIADSVVSSGSYSWNVPNVNSSLCKVRVSNIVSGSPADVSDNVFSVSNQLSQTVKVVKPNGGEVWTAGTTQSIIWSSTGIDTVKIEMTTNNGVNWTTVVAKTQSNGVYDWVVPNQVSTNCKIRVSDASDGTPSDVSDTSFTITAQPTIHVLSPNGGERIVAGNSFNITWSSTSQNIANVRIDFSIDGGATYATTVVTSTQNTGSYLWNPVPNVSSSQCKIKISDASNITINDISDSNFVVVIQPAQTITVTAPNGGEALVAGRSYPITWTSSGISNVGIDYSTNNGVNWTNIVTNIPSNGYYLWNPVPSVSSTNCKVRVYDALDTLPVAQSANQFTILPAPTIAVLAPNGGEQLVSGTVKNILWSSSNIVSVKIELTTNNGASWTTVVDSTPSNGQYAWTVPALNSTLCKIRISEKQSGSPVAESQNIFSITPTVPQSISVIAPNGGESMAPGTGYAIKWVSSGIDSVKIELSTNNGVNWSTIVAKTPSNGVYIWSPIPSLNSTNCKIRVSDAADGDPSAMSANVFSVIAQPTLHITAPNGGEKILAGSSYTITWTTSYAKRLANKQIQSTLEGGKQPNSPFDITNVKLELSTDEGATWQSIIASTPNTGSYAWNPVSNANSALCRVRISDATGSTASDISDSDFVIYNQVAQSIMVKTPSGSEVLTAGGSYDITWSSVSVTAVNIELSTNNGVNWSTIVNNVPSNGFYHWSPVPNVSSTNCKIRISDAVDSIPFALSNSTFNILPAPSVRVISPRGGESYTGGQLVNVLWQSANIVTVKIDLTTNNGASWSTVADSVPSNGVYLWTVPPTNSNLCKIRIAERSSGNPAAVSDTTFIISTSTPQSIKVTVPNGGESFPSGSTQNITWTSTGIDSVKIEFTTDNGVNWQTIVNKTPSNGLYTWRSVPATPSTNCKIRISDAADGNPYAESNAVFTIAPQPALKVIKPAGGEVWATGSTQTIQWSSTNLTNVKLEFTTNNGASWTTIADSTPSTGAYAWLVPNLYSTLCKVKVSNPATGLPYSISDTNFTITNQVQQSLEITSPVGGEVWEGSSSHYITWNSTAISKVKLEFTTDNGISWTTIADSVLSNGLYQWSPVPNTPSTLCKVRISNLSGGSPRDESKATFTINPKRSLTITFPNGGESLTAGTKYTIKWNSSGVQAVNISYHISTDTTKIVTGAPNSGSYDWSPTTPGAGYRIIITDGAVINPVVTESAGSFSVLPEPSIAILAPNSNVQLASGSSYEIKWQSTNITTVKLELTTNNGANWQSIADSVPSTGSYFWTVPNVNSTLCKIRVSNFNGGLPSKIADSTFTIYSVQPKSITVTSPNGGEILPAGSTQSITWTSTGIDSVKIEFTTDNGVNWQTIVDKTISNGFYSWSPIPSLSSTNCKVRISNAANGNNPFGLSANVFTIAPQPAIKIVKPDGGEFWTTGSTQNIQWQATYLSKVKIEYTTNSGFSWTTIVDSTPSTGSYLWTIPNLNSSLCKVKVSNYLTGLPFSVSDSNFTISNQVQQSLVVTSPNGGEVWEASSAHNITWTSSAISKVKIEYTTNNGINWTTIVDSVESNGLYQWNPIPSTASTLCKVRITNANGGTPQAVSNAPFTINPLKSITVVYPNGGESLTAGTIYAIKWNSSGVQTVNIDYRIGNNSQWQSIVSGAPNNGSYNWSPSIASSGYKIRVSDGASGNTVDESDGTFTVLPEPSITVTAPNTSVSLVAGSQFDIKWQSVNLTTVKIDFTSNNGASWVAVIDSTPSTGIYSWTVPSVNSSLCKIRVSNISGLPSAVCDSAFTIYTSLPRSLNVTAPVGGEKYPIGTAQTITWNSTGIDSVKLEYSSDNGISWNTIVASVPSSGYYTWSPIPATLSSNCKVRISAVNGGFFYGQTPGIFSIVPQGSIRVVSPAGGESYISGTSENILWTSQNIEKVTIEYSSNNGSTWNTVAANVPSTGVYTWTNIPVVNSNQCRVKVKEATIGIPYDTSAANFSIIQSKQLRVVFPNASSDVVSKDTTIIWYSVGVTRVNIDLSLDNGLSWSSLAANIPSTGAYSWVLAGQVSSLARIRVTDATDATVTDMSDAPFKLGFTPPSVIKTPDGGFEINWMGLPGKTTILQYSVNGGQSWTDIEEQVTASVTALKKSLLHVATGGEAVRFRIREKNTGNVSASVEAK